MNIKNITLLSEEEFDCSKNIIPKVELRIWWLRTPYYLPHRACAVFANSYAGNSPVSSDAIGVRPALVLEDSNFILGQKVEFLGYSWTVVLIKEGNTTVLCDEIVANHCFDESSNDFETSEIKRFLEDWLKKTQENPVNAIYNYTLKLNGAYVTGSVIVPVDATESDIKLAILEDFEEVSYERVEE